MSDRDEIYATAFVSENPIYLKLCHLYTDTDNQLRYYGVEFHLSIDNINYNESFVTQNSDDQWSIDTGTTIVSLTDFKNTYLEKLFALLAYNEAKVKAEAKAKARTKTEAKVTEAQVTEAKVTEAKVTEAKVTEAQVEAKAQVTEAKAQVEAEAKSEAQALVAAEAPISFNLVDNYSGDEKEVRVSSANVCKTIDDDYMYFFEKQEIWFGECISYRINRVVVKSFEENTEGIGFFQDKKKNKGIPYNHKNPYYDIHDLTGITILKNIPKMMPKS